MAIKDNAQDMYLMVPFLCFLELTGFYALFAVHTTKTEHEDTLLVKGLK